MILACSRAKTGELHVVLHSMTAHAALEVLALPFDPVTIRASASASANGAPSSPAPPAVTALRDSATALNATFQRARVALNHEALALGKAKRASVSYSRAFDSWRKRAQEAEQIRSARDRLRAKLAALGFASDTVTAQSAFAVRSRSTLAQVEAAAGQNGGNIVRATVRNGTATLTLPASAWWIALTYRDGTAEIYSQAISIDAAKRDTLRLSN